MTIESGLSKALYMGNDVATHFPFAFRVWHAQEIVLTVVDSNDVLVPAGAFTVTVHETGGAVEYLHAGHPLPTGWKLAITRNMPFMQGVDLLSGVRFDPAVIETALDVATAERQQLLEEVNRSIKVPPVSGDPPELLVEKIFEARDQAKASASDAQLAADNAAQSAIDAAERADLATQTVQHLETLSFSAHLSDTPNVATEYTPESNMLHFYVPQGPQGVQGARGDQGERGPQGARGDTGAKGDTGERGLQGTAGPMPPPGDKGPMGDSPWSLAFAHMRLTKDGLLLDYTGTTEGLDFTINKQGELEVVL